MGVFTISEDVLAKYIHDISSGDEAALERFYNEYGRLMLAFILSVVRTRESAEEVLQDVLMSIVMYGSSRPIKNPNAWLFKVMRNAAVKRAKEDKSMENETLSEYEDVPSDEDIAEKIEDTVDQIDALKCLDQVEQQCVIMCVFGKMKLPQVAELLGIPYDKVRNKYDYAVKKLKRFYEERRGFA